MRPLDDFSSKNNHALSHMTSIGNYPSLVERLREIQKESNKPFFVNLYRPLWPILGLLRLRSLFSYLPDTPAVCSQWERLIVQYAVIGRDSHDTRIVAAMNVHGITHLLTFNKDDFRRYTNIVAVNPGEVLAAQPAAPAAPQTTATEADEEVK